MGKQSGGTTPSSVDPSFPDDKAENQASKDAREEKEDTGKVDISKPSWVDKDMPDPKADKDMPDPKKD